MKKILIVEDNVDLACNMEYILAKEGFMVSVANDGEEGFKKYLNEKPDLILLDLQLPKLSGNSICRQIRRDLQDNKTIIIMLTSLNEDCDRIIGRVQGANVYLTKPFEFPQLINTIKQQLAILS